MTDRYQQLLEMVHSRAGDAFRVAIRYTPDDFEVTYVRDDLANAEFRETVGETVERARNYEPISDISFYRGLGEHEATVEQYENAVVIHFARGDERGILISLDSDVAQGLGSFIRECTSVLYGE